MQKNFEILNLFHQNRTILRNSQNMRKIEEITEMITEIRSVTNVQP